MPSKNAQEILFLLVDKISEINQNFQNGPRKTCPIEKLIENNETILQFLCDQYQVSSTSFFAKLGSKKDEPEKDEENDDDNESTTTDISIEESEQLSKKFELIEKREALVEQRLMAIEKLVGITENSKNSLPSNQIRSQKFQNLQPTYKHKHNYANHNHKNNANNNYNFPQNRDFNSRQNNRNPKQKPNKNFQNRGFQNHNFKNQWSQNHRFQNQEFEKPNFQNYFQYSQPPINLPSTSQTIYPVTYHPNNQFNMPTSNVSLANPPYYNQNSFLGVNRNF